MAESNERVEPSSDDLDSLLEEYSTQSENEPQEPKVKVGDHIKPAGSPDESQAEILKFVRQQAEQEQKRSEQELLNRSVKKFKESDLFADASDDDVAEMIYGRAARDERFLNVMKSGDQKAINKALSKLAEEKAKLIARDNKAAASDNNAARAAVSGISETQKDEGEDEVSNKKLQEMSDYEFAQFKKSLPKF